MGTQYRTSPDPPEEPTERGAEDAAETATAMRRGVLVATSSVFGLAFLVVALMQVTRVLATSSPYSALSVVDGVVIAIVALAFVAGLVIGRQR